VDSRFYTFLGVAFLLVVSPGPTVAVVTEAAVEHGRVAALWTVAGVGAANSTLALAAALGLSLLVGGHPWMLDAVTIGGALYLAVLGLRSIARALGSHGSGVAGGAGEERATASLRRATPGASFAKGVTTNLLNPSVALFYMTLVPQFIAREDPFLARFTLLCASHVLMAVAWHSMYAWKSASTKNGSICTRFSINGRNSPRSPWENKPESMRSMTLRSSAFCS